MRNPSPVVTQLLTTNLWVRMIASFFALFLNGVFWASLLEYYFSGFGGNLISFAGASLSLIVGSVYSTFLSKMMRDYLAGPTKYLNLLIQIEYVGDSLAGLYQSGLAPEIMLHMKVTLQLLGFYIYRVFAPDNQDIIGPEEDRPVLSMKGLGRDSLAERADARPVTYTITNASKEGLINLIQEAQWEDPIKLVHKLRTTLFQEIATIRKTDKNIDMETIHMALHYLKPVWIQLSSIESGRLIQEPAIFNAHMQVIFIFYFFIWVPISSWAAVGWIPTIIFYPIVAMVFLIPGIINAWISNPWDSTRPVLIADLAGARVKYILNDMDEKFSSVIS